MSRLRWRLTHPDFPAAREMRSGMKILSIVQYTNKLMFVQTHSPDSATFDATVAKLL